MKEESIVSMIEKEAEIEFPYEISDGASYISIQLLKRKAYIAGRTKSIESEKAKDVIVKELYSALAELVRIKVIKDELDEVELKNQGQEFLNKCANYRMNKIKAWNHAKTLLQLLNK